MSTGSLGSKIAAGELVLQSVLSEASLLGGVYTMGYDECLVLTNDLWKHRAGGVPQHCFLLATAMQPGELPHGEDEEVILLRVVGPAPLPQEAELIQVRSEAMREMVTTRGAEAAAASSGILDVLTRNEIQFSAIKAKILGTFYQDSAGGTAFLAFGSDVDSFYSASHYKVYKPSGGSLEVIASYPQRTAQEIAAGREPRRVRMGVVRYASTTRRRAAQTALEAPVHVNVEDFISMKTAVFGMTRLGKSNTMKIIATAVFEHAMRTGEPVGQLLFDPAGEYANVNVQDDTALSQLGPEHVTVFRYGQSQAEEGVRPLTINFFDPASIEIAWSVIASFLRGHDANYIRAFLGANVVGPADQNESRSECNRAERRRAALYATLLKAGFVAPGGMQVPFVASRTVRDAVNSRLQDGEQHFEANRAGRIFLTAERLPRFLDLLCAAKEAGDLPDDWMDTDLDSILKVYRGAVGSGFTLLVPIRPFHDPAATEDYAQAVLSELIAGKIVIIDLHLGSETLLQFCSERIVNVLLRDAARRFSAGEDPHRIQIFIEEAHRLFNRDAMAKPNEQDPYVRLAKEAAKYRIGLIYATQEVTSVDPLILSNTSNWIVTHLNNRAEVQQLSKYYDFRDFAELTLRAEDVGFARVKTRSSRYIVPLQIDRFDGETLERARSASQRLEVPEDALSPDAPIAEVP